MLSKNIKVEIGQEWRHMSWESTRSFVITKIAHCSDWSPGLRGIGVDSKYLNDEIGHMVLTDGKSKYYKDWVYLGTPVRCEDCNKFCLQKC